MNTEYFKQLINKNSFSAILFISRFAIHLKTEAYLINDIVQKDSVQTIKKNEKLTFIFFILMQISTRITPVNINKIEEFFLHIKTLMWILILCYIRIDGEKFIFLEFLQMVDFLPFLLKELNMGRSLNKKRV